MASMSEIKQQALNLLWGGKPDEARRLIEGKRQELQEQMDELTGLLPGGRAQGELTLADVRRLNGNDATHPDELSDDQKDMRRRKVIEAAKKHLKLFGNTVSVDKIKEMLDGEGIELGVQENRKTTTISNILRHSGQYQKISKGKFRPKTAPNRGEDLI
jgi:hypothetical protein